MALKMEEQQIFRPLANFPPCLWGNTFTSFSLDIQAREMYAKEHEDLKEQVKKMLSDYTANYKTSEMICFINTVERLGVSYHFENEIEEQLHTMFDLYTKSQDDVHDFDLFTLGIYFRIMRQHGYKISCHIFDKLKGQNGEFKDELKDDVIGILSLYEATHVRTHGESILDEAFIYTKSRLQSMADENLNAFLHKQVTRALIQALHKGIPRVEAHNFINIYEEDPNKSDLLLRFAKIDFNLLQMLHKQELCDLSIWWKDLEFETKVSYARNRVAECYLWTISVYYEPKYSFARILFVKIMLLLSVTDDTYDAYGTFDELKLFTDAIQRWDMSCINQLPDYMKIIYRTLLELYDEIEDELPQHEIYNSSGVAYSKAMFKEIVRSYDIENKWFTKRYVPTFEEYMKNALVTGGNSLQVVSALLGMHKDVATIQAFEWVQRNPKIIIASNTIVRLSDDIMSHEEEDERGHIATGLECYGKDHGLTKEVVIAKFYEMIENGWKDLNYEYLNWPNDLSTDIRILVINLSRIVDVVYKYDDGYTHPEKTFKDYIIQLFVDSIKV